jgi:hypothetical protein
MHFVRTVGTIGFAVALLGAIALGALDFILFARIWCRWTRISNATGNGTLSADAFSTVFDDLLPRSINFVRLRVDARALRDRNASAVVKRRSVRTEAPVDAGFRFARVGRRKT